MLRDIVPVIVAVDALMFMLETERMTKFVQDIKGHHFASAEIIAVLGEQQDHRIRGKPGDRAALRVIADERLEQCAVVIGRRFDIDAYVCRTGCLADAIWLRAPVETHFRSGGPLICDCNDLFDEFLPRLHGFPRPEADTYLSARPNSVTANH